MSFGLTNTHEAFMDLMNIVFKHYLEFFVIVFIDNILVYSRNEEDHDSHHMIILQTLRDKKLDIYQVSMFEFWIMSMGFICGIISVQAIKVYTKQIEEVQSWTRPTSPKDITSFLGMDVHYKRFVEGF